MRGRNGGSCVCWDALFYCSGRPIVGNEMVEASPMHHPDVVIGEDGAEIDLSPSEADVAAVGDGDGLVVER